MNVSELLRLLQTEHDETATRAGNLCEQSERLTNTLAETEARLAELAATRKVIDGLTPPEGRNRPRGDRHRDPLPAHRDHVQRPPLEGAPRP
ncbi:hypothetical protein [Streptomyces sp. MMS20-AI2-20]|uniref:hypothetical protein n=1 Tax=Streptomyces sp. MMS20-AI2-20 TaxID=2925835 RepID=UPI001F61BCAF|nr:hypothetical protein [Streptomyces sp. MMS20-AI2-20]MCI4145618.1 hypothetical protein [Streptomyces sp. MMS20-AI2-20]